MNLMSPRENTKDGIKHDKKGFKNLFFLHVKTGTGFTFIFKTTPSFANAFL